VITGFNTDVEYDGVTYHVQTEDKGLDSPLILSLVYTGGAILASKRTTYDDLINTGFDEKVLGERLRRQHTLICAAIKAGRIDDLRRMSQRELTARATEKEEGVAAITQPIAAHAPASQAPAQTDAATQTAPSTPAKPAPTLEESHKEARTIPAPPPVPYTVRAILQDVVADFARAEAASLDALHLSLLDEKEFRGGESLTLRVRVGRGEQGRDALNGAEVTIKVLGSTFRPVIASARTGTDGVASLRVDLPHFKTGRAAILVRAVADGYEAELRRIIHQG
jgi:hypothetical protein